MLIILNDAELLSIIVLITSHFGYFKNTKYKEVNEKNEMNG